MYIKKDLIPYLSLKYRSGYSCNSTYSANLNCVKVPLGSYACFSNITYRSNPPKTGYKGTINIHFIIDTKSNDFNNRCKVENKLIRAYLNSIKKVVSFKYSMKKEVDDKTVLTIHVNNLSKGRLLLLLTLIRILWEGPFNAMVPYYLYLRKYGNRITKKLNPLELLIQIGRIYPVMNNNHFLVSIRYIVGKVHIDRLLSNLDNRCELTLMMEYSTTHKPEYSPKYFIEDNICKKLHMDYKEKLKFIEKQISEGNYE